MTAAPPPGSTSSGVASNPSGLPDRAWSCPSWSTDGPLRSWPASRLSSPSRACCRRSRRQPVSRPRNVQLRASLRAEAAALQASRLRLMYAADNERISLADELDRGAGASLEDLRAFVYQIPTGTDPAITAAVERSRSRLAGLEAGLRSLSSGLGPPTLKSRRLGRGSGATRWRCDGRQSALMSRRATYRITWRRRSTSSAPRPSRTPSSTHQRRASPCAFGLRMSDVLVEIVDDGQGGADPEGGSGLQGLVDRTAALGGKLVIASPPGVGTRITADLPRQWPAATGGEAASGGSS